MTCPSNHWNNGNDVCADCGADLNAQPEPGKWGKRFIVICTTDPAAFHCALNELNGLQIESAMFEFTSESGTFQNVGRAVADYFQFPND